MSRFQIKDLLDPSSFLFYTETSICRLRNPLTFPSPFLVAAELEDELALGFALDLLTPAPSPFDRICAPPSPFDVFKSAIDLIQVEKTPLSSSCRRIRERSETDAYLRSLCSRVSALELGLDRALKARPIDGVDRKYKLTAEVKGPEKSGVEKKYKWTAEIKGGKNKHGKLSGVEKNYTWTKEIKGKGKDGPITQTYTFKSSAAPSGGASGAGKAEKKKTESTKLVEIEDADPAAVALKQVFAKRKALAIKNSKGKKKELSAQDAAIIIQVNFRSHLVRRSQALRELRDLAVAKAKLKESRAFFSNFSYRRRIASDPEERQRFSEKIIVLLLTVDAIEGVDPMVRSVRRSMLEELEAMLDVVDPQPPGKFGLLKRRKFDLPGVGSMQKDIALGVAEVVQMLDQEDNGSSVFTEV